MIYFNEFDPFAAAWLSKLYPLATIDKRSIKDVNPEDTVGVTRCHFFGGIGGWEYALELAGWPADREVWTGSCPCQPFSTAGKQRGTADERHLWPDWFRLIRERRPVTIFGEQVASAIGHGWIDGVFADLETEGYTCGAIVLGAHSVGAPHIRQRLFWVADASESRHARAGKRPTINGERTDSLPKRGYAFVEPAGSRAVGGLANSQVERRRISHAAHERTTDREVDAPDDASDPVRLGNAGESGSQGRGIGRDGADQRAVGPASVAGEFWRAFDLIPCRDGKTRRVEPGSFPLAHGVPNRVGRLRGYGNAIVPQIAAEFIRAFTEAERG